jgi:hypothetical protein
MVSVSFAPRPLHLTGKEILVLIQYGTYFAKYNYNDQVEKDEIGRVCSKYGKKRNGYKVLVGKP